MLRLIFTAAFLVPSLATAQQARPFAEQLATIERDRMRAVELCEDAFQRELGVLRLIIVDGVLTDRPRLTHLLVDLGEPQAELAAKTDLELMQAAGSKIATKRAQCDGDAARAATAALQEIDATMQATMAALRERKIAFQELIDILNQLEQFQQGNAALQSQIQALRAEASRLSNEADAAAAQADANAARADEYAARADEYAARADEYAARTECIWDSIQRDALEEDAFDCKDPDVWQNFLDNR